MHAFTVLRRKVLASTRLVTRTEAIDTLRDATSAESRGSESSISFQDYGLSSMPLISVNNTGKE